MGAAGRVEVAGRVASERKITVGRIVVSGCVAKERGNSISRVVESGGVCKERTSTGSYVLESRRIAKERTVTKRRVLGAGGQVLEREIALGCVPIRITSVRCWANRLHRRRQRKGGECDENERAPQRRAAH